MRKVKSIRNKLILIFSIFMTLLIFLGIVLNYFLLEEYYIFRNRELFKERALQISQELDKNFSEATEKMKLYDQRDSINSMLIADEKNVVYASFQIRSRNGSGRIPKELEEMINLNRNRLRKGEIYLKGENSEEKISKLYFIAPLKNGELLVLSKSMRGIKESVEIANRFYLYSGLLIILLGSIVIYFITKIFSKVFEEIGTVAEDISNLNFERKISYQSSDELGQICASINKMSEKLSNSINELRKDVERRKILFRNLSHELKTPIGIIKGYSEGLKFGVAQDPKEIEKYCDVIVNECDIMERMVGGLLKFSHLESDMFSLKITSVNMGEFLKKLIERLSLKIREKNLKLVLKLEENIEMLCDREIIESVFSNLLTNGIEHSILGGKIEVNLKQSEDHVRIEVLNDGNPLTEDELENIWDPFYKKDTSRTRRSGNHGLGLSIVKQGVELHKGSFGAKNFENRILFYFDIPKNLKGDNNG